VPKPSIMIVANEEVISALLGAMVELDGYVPTFCAADEQPLGAILRHRPQLLLLDCEHELAWEGPAMRRIASTGTRTLLFSAMRSQREIEMVAARYDIPAFVLPVAFREFTSHISSVLGPAEGAAAVSA
jgi:CheY-like chemotaxis protein